MSNSHGKYDCLINRKSDTEEEEMNNETSRQENGYNSQKGYKLTDVLQSVLKLRHRNGHLV